MTLLFAAGLAGGYFLRDRVPPPPDAVPGLSSREIRAPEPGTGLTRPLLECEIEPGGRERKELLVFHSRLESFVSTLETDPRLEKVGVYFRDLDNGPWIGIREDERFAPGSVYKVPLIMASYRQAERNPAFLDREVPFGGSETRWSYVFPPAERMEVGKSYRVGELMRRTAVYSDNEAAELLGGALEPAMLDAVLTDLGLDPLAPAQPGQTATAEELGRFFRLLYNASYLSQDHSEEALTLFTRTEFREGLIAGVPAGTVVAHKFGERAGKGVFQLHDCGIVYHPRHRYLLCVMTQGNSPSLQAQAIAAISSFIYQEVSLQLGGE